MRKRRLTPAELQVWRKVARTVTPFRPQKPEPVEEEDFPSLLEGRHHLDVTRPGGRIPVSRTAKASAPPKPAQPESSRLQPAADRGGDRRVRRGRVEVEASLDLHGHTQELAHLSLRAFLAFHRSQGARCVLVITGKGRAGEGVIRKRFLDWLNTPDVRDQVASYAQAHQRHGGGGAFYVFLKRQSKRQ